MSSSVDASEAAAVNANGSFQWSITLFEQRGTCWIGWTQGPFRAQQGRVCLYPGSFPSDPTQATSWSWDDVNQPNPYDTGQPWGAGWCAAYIAQASPNGPYVYFLQTAVTSNS